jgi:hypothetical protein
MGSMQMGLLKDTHHNTDKATSGSGANIAIRLQPHTMR